MNGVIIKDRCSVVQCQQRMLDYLDSLKNSKSTHPLVKCISKEPKDGGLLLSWDLFANYFIGMNNTRYFIHIV